MRTMNKEEMTMNKEQIDAAARRLCEIRGEDADSGWHHTEEIEAELRRQQAQEAMRFDTYFNGFEWVDRNKEAMIDRSASNRSEEAKEPATCNQSPHLQGCKLDACNDTERLREVAMYLWKLLDDIDTAGDMFKPNCIDSFKSYEAYVNKKQALRFQHITSDGYDLFMTKEAMKQPEDYPDHIASGHNPDGLNNAIVGVADGWRLLEREEVYEREWQPIETAPKDGTLVLIKGIQGAVSAWYDSDNHDWVCYDDKFTLEFDEPDHWQPLPEPPKGEG